jgi:hypothetical protein
MTIQEDRSRALAPAGGAIVTAWLDALVEKEILSPQQVRTVLARAISSIGPYSQNSVGYEASGMIATIMHDRFPNSRP